jgi:cyclic beta-1,2-glucan synthetase
VIGLLSGLDTFTPIVAGFLLLILPATQAAVEFMNNLTTSFLRPRALPKLDFSKGIPDDCLTMVAVPSLILNEPQVRDLVLDLEIRFLANRDPNLLFALLTDWPDADQPRDERDALVDVCRTMIEGLNKKYGARGRKPFYLFHRYRMFNPSEGRWMGWERKRGKLHDLNQLLRGGFDSFPIKIGDLSILPDVRYVITLDSDTQLPRDSAAKLVGAIAHPLNRAVIDPATRMVVEGYGILQPRIGVSISSASRSRLASLYSGQTGFDIYTRAVSDVYQDLYGEGIFTGKGIYDVDAMRDSLDHRFPENALLSHDLIEGAYARAALVSDIELIDDYPSHFSAYSRRKHRWVRGDWQIMRWMFSTVPDLHGRMIPNPISLVSQWKIFDNLRRSLLEPNTLLLFLAGWIYLPGDPAYWTLWTVAMLLMPSCSNLLFAVLFAPWKSGALTAWAWETAGVFVKGVIVAVLSIVFLLHQALLSIDAIVRSVLRVFVTKRKLLEWETAAQAEVAARKKATVDVYLDWTPAISITFALAVWLIRPNALIVAAPVLAGWFLSRWISAWLNRSPRARSHELNAAGTELLRDSAERMYRFFRDWSLPATHWLIPDNVREDGSVALRISPTNVGLLLNARIAGVHFGFLSLAEFVSQTKETLATVEQLVKYRGHLMNWYDVETLAPLEPRFVSTVDSGNLVACLWTLKQAALTFAAESKTKRGLTAELAEDLAGIARNCQSLVEATDFQFLYQSRKKVLSVGFDVSRQELSKSAYDLLASESRIASFVAIAKNDVPQEAWFHLGRGQVLTRGERVLLSWTGTMFEYLMPELWMRHYPDTITDQSSRAVVRIQRDYGRRKGVPWGISESACSPDDGGEYGYAPFGIPGIAMKRPDRKALVISPYSSFLALGVDSHAAIDNLQQMAEFGWIGRYGFYEAIDYTQAGAEVIRTWMVHHLGMSLLSACNVLFDNQIQRYFHAEPHVMATELLLHERVPNAVAVDAEEPIPEPAAAHA